MASPLSFWPATLVDWAQIIGALATAGAVIVSLVLARRRPRPELRIGAGLRVIIDGLGGNRTDVLNVSIVNTGPFDANVRNIGWRTGGLRRRSRRHAVQMFDDNHHLGSAAVPCRLVHGQGADLFLETGGPSGWLTRIEEHGFFPEVLDSRRKMDGVRLIVSTSVGKAHETRPEKSMLDEIWTAQQKYFATGRQG